MTLKEIKSMLIQGEFQKTFSNLYGETRAKSQPARYLDALDCFQHYFNVSDDVSISIYSAPGRTEIAGNHTDHQHGCVVAASVHLDMLGIVMQSGDTVRIKSSGYDEDSIDICDLAMREEEKGTSASLIRGIMTRFKQNDRRIGGFHAYVTSEVLKGSGLSSSAAFEILIGTILNGEFNEGELDAVEIALAGQYAENEYFGKPCGLMDQLASSEGGIVFIDFKNEEKPVVQRIDLDLTKQKHTLCVVDTGGSHVDLTDDYASIPVEMKAAAKALGHDVLREVNEQQFYESIPQIRKTCGDRAVVRAIHFFMENKNVKSIMEALQHQDFEAFLKRLRQSGHYSFCYLQNVFGNSTPDSQGLSVALAVSENMLGENGAYRIHGGGFAGTILALVPDGMIEAYESSMNQIFGDDACHRLHLRNTGACKVMPEMLLTEKAE